jgi:class 3 adenylate cyclase
VAGERFSFRLPVQKAQYRLRSGTRVAVINVNDTIGAVNFCLKTSEAWPSQINLRSQAEIQIESHAEQTLVFEELRRQDLALRPEHLVFFPEFRELFSEEYLKSDVKLHLGDQALLFTDIVGSTLFYERVGDAKAFAQVRGHFQDVFSLIKAHEGQVVKTIGDAVMGVFPSIEQAYLASCEIQKKFATGLHPDIRLRISLHHGVVIGVQLENGFDYFGSVINTCAKIQSLAGAQEIALPAEVFQELTLGQIKITQPVQDKLYAAGSEREMPVKVVKVE